MKAIDDAASVEFESGGRGARDRILAAARTLLYRDGIHARSVDELAQYAHVSKRTFYQHFATKDQLVEAYVRDLDATRAIPRERALTEPGMPARARLLAIFDSAPETRMRGCPFHNAAVEAASTLPEVHDIVHAHKLAFIATLIEVCAEAGAADPHTLGHQLAVIFEGGLALSTNLDDSAPMVYARSAAGALVDVAIPRRV
jgi:AcrR family transcriptional regulator